MMDTARKKSSYRQIFAALTANLVTFAYGVYTGWPATVQPLLQSSNTPLDVVLSDESISWSCSLGYMSAILGTLIWGVLADKFGRKITGYLTMAPFLVGWIIIMTSKSEYLLLLARFLGGLGGSGAAINSPMFVGEISDESMNAILGSLFILMYNAGVLYVYVFGTFMNYVYLNIACLAVSVAFMVIWYYIPESPTCLVRKNNISEARESLKWFRGTTNDKEVETELESLSMRSDQVCTASIGDYLETSTIKALIIGFIFQTGTQLCGINVILMYAVDIFNQSGSTLSPEMCTMLVGFVQVLGSVVACFVVTKADRKFFLISTYIIAAVSLYIIGGCFYAKFLDNTVNTGILPVLCLSMHVIAFSIGLGMVPYIIYTEIFSPNVRNVCMSGLMFWNNVLGFGVIKAYPYLLNSLHISGCFWLFAMACTIIVPITYFFIPETKDKTYDQIHNQLQLWFPGLNDKAKSVTSLSVNSTKVVVVESSDKKVYMENNQQCCSEP
ncbi:facilitated trehalose transporter Tret1-like [Daktulosphaira vitifoliae]|uniref:facilitated trehalose transporter Tret1-like n=1 Tax=Daktulosphaira vitifoliae TaxID=58002 RepID=UPI0021AACC05|nr:facilitated trehalose transporter Tret1-like [Daktulosphaira vitifoliae]